VLRKYEYRRKLSHFQPDHKAFFVTFSTHRRWILPENVRKIVIETCLEGNGNKFHLYAIVVMPDHVHLILVPLNDQNGPISIAEIMQVIKGASAHRINRALGRKGKVWEEESFDRALRREESIAGKVEYIMGNPVAEGLAENPLDYRWMWRDVGAPVTGEDARPPLR
jgi:putative transposase